METYERKLSRGTYKFEEGSAVNLSMPIWIINIAMWLLLFGIIISGIGIDMLYITFIIFPISIFLMITQTFMEMQHLKEHAGIVRYFSLIGTMIMILAWIAIFAYFRNPAYIDLSTGFYSWVIALGFQLYAVLDQSYHYLKIARINQNDYSLRFGLLLFPYILEIVFAWIYFGNRIIAMSSMFNGRLMIEQGQVFTIYWDVVIMIVGIFVFLIGVLLLVWHLLFVKKNYDMRIHLYSIVKKDANLIGKQPWTTKRAAIIIGIFLGVGAFLSIFFGLRIPEEYWLLWT